jgi:hypothetical protein
MTTPGSEPRPYRDADGISRFCNVCRCPLWPNILENFWVHDGAATCSAVTDDYGMQRYTQTTAIEVTA